MEPRPTRFDQSARSGCSGSTASAVPLFSPTNSRSSPFESVAEHRAGADVEIGPGVRPGSYRARPCSPRSRRRRATTCQRPDDAAGLQVERQHRVAAAVGGSGVVVAGTRRTEARASHPPSACSRSAAPEGAKSSCRAWSRRSGAAADRSCSASTAACRSPRRARRRCRGTCSTGSWAPRSPPRARTPRHTACRVNRPARR